MPLSDATFDLVVSSMAIHNIDENNLRDHARRFQALDEAVRVLNPGGRLIYRGYIGLECVDAVLPRPRRHSWARHQCCRRAWRVAGAGGKIRVTVDKCPLTIIAAECRAPRIRITTACPDRGGGASGHVRLAGNSWRFERSHTFAVCAIGRQMVQSTRMRNGRRCTRRVGRG
jgi:SAM-dependent methyltransferase